MQKFHEQTGNAYQDMQLAMSSQAVYIHQHEEIIKRLLSVLSDLSSQVRSLKHDTGSSNGRPAPVHQEEELVSSGETGGMGSEATSPINHQQQQGGGSPLQQAQRLMEGYQNLQRPSIQAPVDQFQMHQDQPPLPGPGGYDSAYPHNGQIISMNGVHDQSGHHMFPGMGQSYNGGQPPGQASWDTPPPHQHQGSGINSAMGTPGRPAPTRKRSTPNTPHWRQQPRVLLVEDDPTCRRIGSKFLSSAQCLVDVAVSDLWRGFSKEANWPRMTV